MRQQNKVCLMGQYIFPYELYFKLHYNKCFTQPEKLSILKKICYFFIDFDILLHKKKSYNGLTALQSNNHINTFPTNLPIVKHMNMLYENKINTITQPIKMTQQERDNLLKEAYDNIKSDQIIKWKRIMFARQKKLFQVCYKLPTLK